MKYLIYTLAMLLSLTTFRIDANEPDAQILEFYDDFDDFDDDFDDLDEEDDRMTWIGPGRYYDVWFDNESEYNQWFDSHTEPKEEKPQTHQPQYRRA